MTLFNTRKNTPPYIHFTGHAVSTSFVKASPILPTLPKNFAMKSIFSNNANVCYKPHSLPTGGIGSVRNHHAKGKRT
jgi:hypothetical protein